MVIGLALGRTAKERVIRKSSRNSKLASEVKIKSKISMFKILAVTNFEKQNLRAIPVKMADKGLPKFLAL